jgi:hypothetical protein
LQIWSSRSWGVWLKKLGTELFFNLELRRALPNSPKICISFGGWIGESLSNGCSDHGVSSKTVVYFYSSTDDDIASFKSSKRYPEMLKPGTVPQFRLRL